MQDKMKKKIDTQSLEHKPIKREAKVQYSIFCSIQHKNYKTNILP